MRNNFAGIDRAVTAVLERDFPAAAVRETAKTVSTRVVAGFHIPDPSLEDEIVERAAQAQSAAVDAFRADRAAAAKTCADRGVEPLAIIPTATWAHVCEATGLFRLSPGRDGAVGFSRAAFAGIKDEKGMTGAEQVEWLAANDWPTFLRRLFPAGVSVEGGHAATLVMPTPPADVAAVLLKAKDLDLKVATVAEAVGFKETPSQMYERVRSQEEAIARMLRDDPIIYFEHGTATAILAQFGEFPIELEVVERVLSAEALMGYFPGQVVG
jgi:hypothetical protein